MKKDFRRVVVIKGDYKGRVYDLWWTSYDCNNAE